MWSRKAKAVGGHGEIVGSRGKSRLKIIISLTCGSVFGSILKHKAAFVCLHVSFMEISKQVEH